MLDMKTPIRFFMGSNTSFGFFGFIDDFYDCDSGWRVYLLKGGPGMGKTMQAFLPVPHMPVIQEKIVQKRTADETGTVHMPIQFLA